MEKYKFIEIIGKGSFGEVQKAQNIETGEIVAIKTMKQKYSTWEECMSLRELKSLRKLNHKNIIKLKEVIRQNNQLSFVFEHGDLDIYKLYEEQKKLGQKLPESQIKSIFYQLAQSLSYIHKHGFFHRDLKPENIMFNSKIKYVKLIDFGLAREIRSRPPYTDYVSTRWYRAPELLLRSTNYNSPVDIFALGCIMAELFMLKPLFNGSSESDQLIKICSILGTPPKSEWPEGYRLATSKGINFPQYPPISLQNVITDCPYQAIQLISECLKWDPQKRPTAQKIIQHQYFFDVEQVLPNGYFNDETHIQSSNNHENNYEFQKQGKSEEIGTGKQRLSNQFSVSDGQINNKLRGLMDPSSPQESDSKKGGFDNNNSNSNNGVGNSNNNLNDFTNNNGNSRNTGRRDNLNQKRVSRQLEERGRNRESGLNYNDLGNVYDEDKINDNNNNSTNININNNSNNSICNNNNRSGQKNRATSLQQKNGEFNFLAKQNNKVLKNDDNFKNVINSYNNNDILGEYIPSLALNIQNRNNYQYQNNNISENKKNIHSYNLSNDFLNQNISSYANQNTSLQQEYQPSVYQSSIETGSKPDRNLYQFGKQENLKINQYSGGVFFYKQQSF